jgi:hypothetical protein
MIGRNWTEGEIALATKLGSEGKTAKEIAVALNRTRESVDSKLRKANIKYKKNEFFDLNGEDALWFRENFNKLKIRECAEIKGMTINRVQQIANLLGLSKQKKRSNVPLEIQNQIAEEYKTHKNKGKLKEKYGYGMATISKIIAERGIEFSLYSKFDDIGAGIIKDFNDGILSMRQMEIKYDYSMDQMRNKLKELGIYDENRWEKTINKKPYYQCWVDKYGEEKARQLDIEYRKKKSEEVKARPYVYRDAPQGSGNGWKGWYDGHYFRSLRELCFIVEMDEAGIEWNSAEKKIYDIPYIWDGNPRIYRPDFVIGNLLYEIKPIRLHTSPKVSAKAKAAHEFCSKNGLTYIITDVEIKPELIKKYYDLGRVKFDRDYEERFLNFLKKNQKAG